MGSDNGLDAMMTSLHTSGPHPLEQEGEDFGIRHHVQIGAPHGGLQEGPRSAEPASTEDRAWLAPEPAMCRGPCAVDIIDNGCTERRRCIDGRLEKRIVAGRDADMEWPLPTPRRCGAKLVPFHLGIAATNLFPAPARAAPRRPAIIICGRAACIDHAIDGAGPAKRAPPDPIFA